MQRKSSCWLFVPGGLFACTGPVPLALFHLDYGTTSTMPTLSIVTLTQTYPESPAPAEQLVVFGQVSDADGIVDNEEDFDHNGGEL